MAVCEADRLLSEVLDSTTGLPAAWAADEDVQKIMSVDIWPAFFEQTETGRRFAEDYLFDEKIQNRIAQEFARRFGVAGEINSRHSWPGAIFVSRLEEVIGDILRTNDPSLTLADPPEPETPAPERPRDSRGRFVNEIAQEVQDDLNGNTTTRDIKEKIRTNPQYRTEWEKAHTPQAQKTVSATNELAIVCGCLHSNSCGSIKAVYRWLENNRRQSIQRFRISEVAIRSRDRGLDLRRLKCITQVWRQA